MRLSLVSKGLEKEKYRKGKGRMLYTRFMELLCETQPKSEGLLWKGS